MNTNYQTQMPKYHRIMTVLAEVACVCLIIATLLVGLGDALLQAKHSAGSRNDLQSAETTEDVLSIPGGMFGSVSDGSSSGSLEGDYSFVVINPDKSESGSTSMDSYISGSFASGAYEVVTDENGKTYYKYYASDSMGENGNLVFDNFATLIPVGPSDITPIWVSYTSDATNLSMLIFCFLPCVLLLLYTLHLYQKPNSRRLMAVVAGIYAAGFLSNAVSSLSFIGRIGVLPLLTVLLIPAALAVLLGILTVQFWKGTAHRKFALATFILAWLNTGYNLLSGNGISGGPVIDTGHIIYMLGMLAFQVALFVYAYRKEEATPGDTPDNDHEESPLPADATV